MLFGSEPAICSRLTNTTFPCKSGSSPYEKVGSSDGLYPEIKLSIASISDKKLSEFNRFFLLKRSMLESINL